MFAIQALPAEEQEAIATELLDELLFSRANIGRTLECEHDCDFGALLAVDLHCCEG